MLRRFQQVDVFTTVRYGGNPVAVILDAEGLSDADMQRVADWTNLSETTFVLPPSSPAADYSLRIFTIGRELPFAGHPTLGSCHAWLSTVAASTERDVVVQECGAGLVTIRRTSAGLAFAAPPRVRTGPVDADLVASLAAATGVPADQVVDAQWVDNGPGWVALLLADAAAVLAASPGAALPAPVGLAGPYPPAARGELPAARREWAAPGEGAAAPGERSAPGYPAPAPDELVARGEPALEVRAFFPSLGSAGEDPVTGSLNASLAQWLLETGRMEAPYVVSQGSALGRVGRVHISTDETGGVWVAGGTATCIAGTIEL